MDSTKPEGPSICEVLAAKDREIAHLNGLLARQAPEANRPLFAVLGARMANALHEIARNRQPVTDLAAGNLERLANSYLDACSVKVLAINPAPPVSAAEQPGGATGSIEDINRIWSAMPATLNNEPFVRSLYKSALAAAHLARQDQAAPEEFDISGAKEQSEAWFAVCGVLSEIAPHWQTKARNGMESAVATIRSLAAPAVGSAPQAAELVELLKAIRPNYGAVGSRDVDVTAQRKRIDRAIGLLSASAPQAERASAAPDKLRLAAREMTAALDEHEWAEHVSDDPDAAALEHQITFLIGEHDRLSAIVRAATVAEKDVSAAATYQPGAQQAAVPVAQEAEQMGGAQADDLDMQTIRERDYNADMADKLAAGIAEHFEQDIGEHSSDNCPWLRALEILDTKPELAPCAGTAATAQATPAASSESQPTDLSKQLRRDAEFVGMAQYIQVRPQMLLAAASEIERYYGGMLAWKRTAEAKDREFAAASSESVADDDEFMRLVNEASQAAQYADHGKRARRAFEELAGYIESLIAARVAGVRKDAEQNIGLLHIVVEQLKTRLTAADACIEKMDGVRKDALEEAANICDGVNNYDNPMTARDCADAIRALPASPASGSQEGGA
jgi:hypothetical protein